jgi:drug/metabolite transporter (DMT)-like permease
LCIAFSGILYRTADVSPETGATFRALYGLPVLALVAWLERRRFGPLPARTRSLAIIAGAFFAADLILWHHAIAAVGAGLSTVLGNLQVILVGVGAWLFFGERPSRSVVLALPIVLVGVALISGVLDSGAYGRDPVLGVVLGVATAFAYGGYLLIMRRGGRDARRPAGPVAIATLTLAICSAVVGLLVGTLAVTPTWPTHGWLILYGLTSQSAGYLLISVSLPRLPAVVTSIILLVQPVATVLLSIVLLHEAPSAAQLLGVALVVGGIAAATVPLERLRTAFRPTVAA